MLASGLTHSPLYDEKANVLPSADTEFPDMRMPSETMKYAYLSTKSWASSQGMTVSRKVCCSAVLPSAPNSVTQMGRLPPAAYACVTWVLKSSTLDADSYQWMGTKSMVQPRDLHSPMKLVR